MTLSFEAFPPKKDSDFDSVATAVEKIAQLKPDFMSVTYGAGGGTSTYTSQIAQIVQDQGVTALAHLIFGGRRKILPPQAPDVELRRFQLPV